MNRRGNSLVLSSLMSLAVALGCGGRTDPMFDDAPGANAGGSTGLGGSSTAGGSFNSGGGSSLPSAGSSARGGSATGGFGAGGSSAGGSSTGGSGLGGVPAGGSGASAGGAGMGSAAGAGPIVQLCVAAAQNECDKCQCQSCGSQITGCFSDVGCASIFACAERSQCAGFSCYQNSTCRGVIDQFGGLTGSSLARVSAIAACAVTTRTACRCN